MSKTRLIVVGLGGLAVVLLPYLLRLDLIDNHPNIGDFGSVAAITSGILVNVGTTILLGVMFIALEPWFQNRVRTSAAAGAEDAIRRETAGLVKANGALISQVEQLQTKVENFVAASREDRSSVFERLADEISWVAVCDALELANTLETLADGRIFVPGSSRFEGPKVEFYWGTRSSLYVSDIEDDEDISLTIACLGASVEWREDESTEQLANRLEQEMTRVGVSKKFDELDWAVLSTNLSTALSDALKAKREDSTAWFAGRLYGIVADGWAVTSKGLEVRNRGTVIKPSDFPIKQMKKSGGAPDTLKEHIERPSWASADDWAFAVEETRLKHTRYAYSAAGSLPSGQVAFTQETSPRASKK